MALLFAEKLDKSILKKTEYLLSSPQDRSNPLPITNICSIDLPLYYLYKYYYLLFYNTPRFLNYSVFTHLEINLSIPSPARVNKYGEN